MSAYYNEFDPFAAEWLRELIKAGAIAAGDVDQRSILDVKPDDLKGYTQCHFFAGIGVWSYALRAAGWSDDTPVWTGSCPCQPFSAAGAGAGFTDERHLWPHWFHLISQREPSVVFGEQVASKDGLGWLDLVQTDMEAAEYAFAPVDICAAGVGSPNLRQRLFFVADAERAGPQGRGRTVSRQQHENGQNAPLCAAGGLGNADSQPAGGHARTTPAKEKEHGQGEPSSDRPADAGRVLPEGLADTGGIGREVALQHHRSGAEEKRVGQADGGRGRGAPDVPGPTNGLWADADWLGCRDGKWRAVEPGTSPLVDGPANRVGRLRGYGNAINAEVATQFIGAYLDVNT